mgnify:FL=1
MANTNAIIPIKIDIRGFIRIQKNVAKASKISLHPYAEIFVDQANKRIGISLTKKLSPTAFRVLPNPASDLI